MDNKEQVVTDEVLSKAIDDLIAEQFGSEDVDEEIVKGNGQPDNSTALNQLPKDTDVNANGGKDVIKAEKDDDEDEEDLEKKSKMEAEKCAKKSKEALDVNESESLIKSLTEEAEELKKSKEELKKSNEQLAKSFEDFQKSIDEKFENIGEIFKGMKYEIDQLRKSPVPRKSVKNVDEIKKSFEDNRDDQTNSKETIKKSEVEDAIESLVKSGELSSSVLTEFEMFGKIQNPGHSRRVSTEIMKMRKKS